MDFSPNRSWDEQRRRFERSLRWLGGPRGITITQTGLGGVGLHSAAGLLRQADRAIDDIAAELLAAHGYRVLGADISEDIAQDHSPASDTGH